VPCSRWRAWPTTTSPHPRTRPRRYPAAASIPTSGSSSRTSAPSSSDATGSNPSAPISPVPSTSPRSTGCPTSRTCVTGGRPTSTPLERRARGSAAPAQRESAYYRAASHLRSRASTPYPAACRAAIQLSVDLCNAMRPPAAGSAQASMVTCLATNWSSACAKGEASVGDRPATSGMSPVGHLLKNGVDTDRGSGTDRRRIGRRCRGGRRRAARPQ
jgi:hypothetical protein